MAKECPEKGNLKCIAHPDATSHKNWHTRYGDRVMVFLWLQQGPTVMRERRTPCHHLIWWRMGVHHRWHHTEPCHPTGRLGVC